VATLLAGGGQILAPVLLLTGVAHLVLAPLGGEPFWRALLPPVAWAFLLADRAAPQSPRRQAYGRALLTGALGGGAAIAGAIRVWGADAVVPWATESAALAMIAALTLLACALGLVAVRGRGAAAGALRLGLLAMWGVGACVLVGGAVLLAVPGLLAGRMRPLLRFAARTAAGVVETVLPPARMPTPDDLGHDPA
jgi:hypothetical protein